MYRYVSLGTGVRGRLAEIGRAPAPLYAWERAVHGVSEDVASLAESRPPIEQVTERIVQRVGNIKRHRDRRQLAQGWSELGCGIWVPPGWVWTGEGDPRDAVAEAEKVGDSVSDSSNSSTSRHQNSSPGSPRRVPKSRTVQAAANPRPSPRTFPPLRAFPR